MPSDEEVLRLMDLIAAAGGQSLAHKETAGLIYGLPLTIASDEEAESAAFVVCAFKGQELERFKATNVYTECADCKSPITHRPHAPEKPPKICLRCALKRTTAALPIATNRNPRIGPNQK